jgi:hypothetical protein
MTFEDALAIEGLSRTDHSGYRMGMLILVPKPYIHSVWYRHLGMKWTRVPADYGRVYYKHLKKDAAVRTHPRGDNTGATETVVLSYGEWGPYKMANLGPGIRGMKHAALPWKGETFLGADE